MEISYNAQGRAEMLKGRLQRCVCRYCGRPLHLKRIIFSEFDDARVELYCEQCRRIEFGVEPELYHCAQYYIHMLADAQASASGEEQSPLQANIAKICNLLSWSLKNLGLLNQYGFKVPLDMELTLLNKVSLFSAADIERLNAKEQTND